MEGIKYEKHYLPDPTPEKIRQWAIETLHSRSTVAEGLRKTRRIMAPKRLGLNETWEKMRDFYSPHHIRVPEASQLRNEEAVKRHFF
jgi:hypothetical protein